MTMPELVRRDPEAERVRDTVAARAQFAAGFRRSQRGNAWRTRFGLTVTVFRRPAGRWDWCIAGVEGRKRFGPGPCETAEVALSSVAFALGIG
jgi:hypothetical protein